MPTLTISEALGQIQVIDQHIARKQKLVDAYLLRNASIRDPLAREGGTPAILARELRSIAALQERKILIRRAVQAANERASITHEGENRSVADWLVWKREVLARQAKFLKAVRNRINQARRELSTVPVAAGAKRPDLVVHLNETELSAAIEALEEREGYLAGQVSLRNATTAVELPGDETWRTGLEERFDELLARVGVTVARSGLTVVLDGFDVAHKIAVIKVVREILGLGLAEAKAFVEAAPRPVKEDVSNDEAQTLRQKLVAVGARVSLR